MAAPMTQADSKWPRWPDGTKGKQLVRVRVAWDVDTLFKAMFGTASPFAVRRILGSLCASRPKLAAHETPSIM